MLFQLLFSLAASFQPTATPPWPTKMPRAEWPTPTEAWPAPPTEFPDDSKSHKLDYRIVVGIAVGAVVVSTIIAVVVVYIIKKKKTPEQLKQFQDELLSNKDDNDHQNFEDVQNA